MVPSTSTTIEKFDAFARIGTKWTKLENFIGNGPFKLSEHKINSVIEASVAETYWDRNQTRFRQLNFIQSKLQTPRNGFSARAIYMLPKPFPLTELNF